MQNKHTFTHIFKSGLKMILNVDLSSDIPIFECNIKDFYNKSEDEKFEYKTVMLNVIVPSLMSMMTSKQLQYVSIHGINR